MKKQKQRRLSAFFAILLGVLGATLLTYVGLGGILLSPSTHGFGYAALALTVLLSAWIFSLLLFALHRFRVGR